MSNFHAQWSTAKTKFENDTGMKKPADMGKVFLVSYRKGSGIDDTLKDLDKLFPPTFVDPISDKTLTALQELTVDLGKSSGRYLDLLDKSIKEEKETIGKDKSKTYRDLKILRATLEEIVSRATLDTAKLAALKEGDQQGVEKAVRITVMQMKTLVHSLDAAIKASTVTAQEILKDPRPATYNASFKNAKAARDVTQPLLNFAKWTLPKELAVDTLKSRDKAMESESVRKEAGNLYHLVGNFRDQLAGFLKEQGDSPTTANIARLANKGIELPGTASPQDVVAAIKHFISELKRVRDLAASLKEATR